MTSCLDFLSHEGHFSLPHSNVLYVVHLTAVPFNFCSLFYQEFKANSLFNSEYCD